MMRRCLTLARRAAGYTSPNPLVGCVIVQGDHIVGEGYHPKAGEPHAEVFALRAAGTKAQGATAYVNLEPCNHYGRTPPCSEALIAAQVDTVVVGMVDPDPRVSGKGIERLRSAGIKVWVGVEEEACQRLNEAFVHRVRYQRPFGILKYAMTLDGKIATKDGHSAWITNERARTHVHELRATCDAVIVGGNTMRLDNPHLTNHQSSPAEQAPPNPLRVVMSRTLNLPPKAYLWQTEVAPTLVLTQGDPAPEFQTYLQQQGVEVINLPKLTPQSAMAYLGERDLLSVLWECGGTLAAQAIADGSVQKVLAFIAPKIVGGQQAPSPVGELGFTKMTDAIKLERVQWHIVGEDCLVEGYLPRQIPSV
ncbi:MAG: bifunctional diaminohydroxyphosphoribosylaminopyrimidine deaminase/5-amino-6-(5-phosphoribosylamino)uracil reductase RibD [Acaryochloridaceae cyanobacterium SU_2_1]|nr:bifunctional diaminohydroxyphosphoribosylaminopyrimidine deaminase/5-amino-6-(5-phosphoribosylamino)uracil reductase RibD [Acaryochloridaceae cyanobacterium SU_2_1]